MAVSLKKGQKVSLAKETARGKAVMGLGWDAITEKTGGFFGFGAREVKRAVDLDASCLMFDAEHRLVDMVSFRQLRSKDGSVVHTGDNRTGAGDGDDEQIRVDLGAVPTRVATLAFVVNCYSNLDFSKVANAYCRLVDEQTNTEVAKFDLGCQGSHTALFMATIARADGDWTMKAVGATGAGRTADQLEPMIRRHLTEG